MFAAQGRAQRYVNAMEDWSVRMGQYTRRTLVWLINTIVDAEALESKAQGTNPSMTQQNKTIFRSTPRQSHDHCITTETQPVVDKQLKNGKS